MVIKMNKRVIIGLILIAIIFSSSYMLAKYNSLLRGSSELRNVAKWNVEFNGCDINNPNCNEENEKNVSLIAGNDSLTQTYQLNVKSISEVSAKYKIILSNVPDSIQVKIDDGDYQSATNHTITFTSVNYTINSNDLEKEKNHIMTFKVPLDSEFNSINNIDVNLKFEQND